MPMRTLDLVAALRPVRGKCANGARFSPKGWRNVGPIIATRAKPLKEWTARGAQFLTESKDHGREIRAYVRDPDGHLIEVGQTTGLLG
jgi:catechol 2,3-dioxygenase-like lactoylglutathione lyase family enzyme